MTDDISIQVPAVETPTVAETPPAAEPESPKRKVMGFVASSARNPWLCSNGHLMGIIVRKKVAGGIVPRLYVLRLSFQPQEVVPETMIFAVIDSGTVACSICGSSREWRPSPNFLSSLKSRRR